MSTTAHVLSNTSHVLAMVEDWQPGDTVSVSADTASANGLPAKAVSFTVEASFENNEIGSTGCFLQVPRELYTDDEVLLAQKRGIFQVPEQEDKTVPQLPWETNMTEEEGFVRAFVTSPSVSSEGIQRIQDDFRRGTSSTGNETGFQLVVNSFDATRSRWLPIDYALLVGRDHLADPQQRNCLEAFLLIDERSTSDRTVVVVYQLTQLPVRRDPIRVARYGAETIGEVLPAIVAGSWKFLDAFKEDPEEAIVF